MAAHSQSILTGLAGGNRRVPLAIRFTVDYTAAPEDVTFLATNHKSVFVSVVESKSREKYPLWNMWLATDDF